MGQRSKVITALPKELRDELDQKLVKGAFSDYRGLEAWLGTQGFRISRGSLQRYGSAFERRIKTIGIATQQARALAEASPDREGSMTDALARLVQEKLFSVLVEAEDIEDGQLTRIARAIADLGRATISQKRWQEEMRERLDEQKRAAAEKMGAVKSAGGLSDAAYDAMRAILLDIDPTATKEQQSGSHHARYLR
jgi:Protein of unknown function (DUF3486)